MNHYASISSLVEYLRHSEYSIELILTTCWGLLKYQNLIPIIFLTTVLSRWFQAFGLPKIFIPEITEDNKKDPFYSGIAVSGLLLAISIGAMSSDPMQDFIKTKQEQAENYLLSVNPDDNSLSCHPQKLPSSNWLQANCSNDNKLSYCFSFLPNYIKQAEHYEKHTKGEDKQDLAHQIFIPGIATSGTIAFVTLTIFFLGITLASREVTSYSKETKKIIKRKPMEDFYFAAGLLPLLPIVITIGYLVELRQNLLLIASIPPIALLVATYRLLKIGTNPFSEVTAHQKEFGQQAGETVSLFLACLIYSINFINYFNIPWILTLVVLAALATWTRSKRDPYALKLKTNISTPTEQTSLEASGHCFIPAQEQLANAKIHAFSNTTEKKPLVLVCASGGGIRAAIWTIRTLVELQQRCKELFKPHIFFGASGGMLGVTRYITAQDQPQLASGESDPRVKQVEKEGLSGLLQQFLTRDIPSLFVPWLYNGTHRGEVIENTWRKNFGLKKGQDLTFKEIPMLFIHQCSLKTVADYLLVI